MIPASIPELETPALAIDLDAMERNLRRMADYFAARPCKLRPHAKTHKCPVIARRQIELGAIGITCAKIGEAEVLGDGGIQDILIANEVVGPSKVRRLAALARRCAMTVAVDSLDNARAVGQAAREAGATVGVLVEIDTGMGRCGLPPEPAGVLAFVREVSRVAGLRFRGLMGYEGHAVLVNDPAERRTKAEAAGRLLLECADQVRRAGFGAECISGGGTGTYDITAQLTLSASLAPGEKDPPPPQFTEIQAGSYVFMDARYRQVRQEFENALFLATTVVSRPTPDRVILDGGMKSVTHEFGLPVVFGRSDLEVANLSEEHVKCVVRGESCGLRPGDQVWLLPSHCCTTANLHDRYWCIRDGRLVGTWAIAARGKFA
jgi:D-serine deaminase-like pyridoxal phosphate-dependent protein